MTMLPAAVAEALAEPGCFVDSHRTPDGVWLHRAVYTGPDAAPAAELGAAGPDGTWQRLRRQPGEGDADLLELAVKHLRGCGFDQRADAVADVVEEHRIAAVELTRAVELAESFRALLERAAPYRDMWSLQLQNSDAYRAALEAVLRAESLAGAKTAAKEALR